MTSTQWRGLRWGLFFASPWIIGFLAFTLYPIVASFYFSFTDFNILNFSPNWVGLDNYSEMVTRDKLFWLSLRNTGLYVAQLIVLATVFDIFIAALLSLNVRGLSIHRTIFFLPVVVPLVAAAMTWVWILNPKYGLINGLLARAGVDGPYWLASPRTALFSVVLIAVWSSGRAVLIYLAGLNDIPRHLYEAAEIDGANPVRKLWHITLPLLTPQILFNVVTLLIFSMQAFTEPYVMTQGGPANATTLYALHLYNRAFQDLSMGYASAMAWLLFLIIFSLTLLLFRLSRRYVYYER